MNSKFFNIVKIFNCFFYYFHNGLHTALIFASTFSDFVRLAITQQIEAACNLKTI